MINSKEQIIEYFKSGIKKTKDFRIGIEHEKFLFDNHNNKRINYSKIKEMFAALLEFGWNPILEKDNIIGLNKGGKNITLEPGNQIELSGEKLNHIHEACAESQDYLFELRQVTKKLDINIVSAGFDPISKLDEIPNNPKQRYELMTKDMPLGGELSLDMMYRTCGTQLNIDYNSEQDFIKKFKIVNSIVPITIALFANSSIKEKLAVVFSKLEPFSTRYLIASSLNPSTPLFNQKLATFFISCFTSWCSKFRSGMPLQKSP